MIYKKNRLGEMNKNWKKRVYYKNSYINFSFLAVA